MDIQGCKKLVLIWIGYIIQTQYDLINNRSLSLSVWYAIVCFLLLDPTHCMP